MAQSELLLPPLFAQNVGKPLGVWYLDGATAVSKAKMSMEGYLSLNQCRNTEDLGTNCDCLENQFLNWVMIGGVGA